MDQPNVGIITFIVILTLFILRDWVWINDHGASSSHPRNGNGEISQPREDNDKVYWKPVAGGPGSKFSSAKFIGPNIKILYCYSSGYKNAYDQYAEFVQEKYPQILIEGSNYPTSLANRVAAHALTALKFLLLGTMLTNQWSFFRLLGLPLRFIAWINENKMYAAILSFFLLNLLENQLSLSGAFEVYIDDVPIWSKIQSGRLPNPGELVQMIENHLKLGTLDAPVFRLSPA